MTLRQARLLKDGDRIRLKLDDPTAAGRKWDVAKREWVGTTLPRGTLLTVQALIPKVKVVVTGPHQDSLEYFLICRRGEGDQAERVWVNLVNAELVRA